MTPEPYHVRLRRVQRLTPDCNYRVDIAIASVPRFLEMYNVNLDPEYQRGYVWTTAQKQAFVGAVLQNNASIPIFWFNNLDLRRAEVVDGKQRLSAILGWLNDEYEAVCPCGESFRFSQADEIAGRNLDMMVTLKMHFVKLSRLDVLKFYLGLNQGGTVHTAEDLGKVKEAIWALETQPA